jgi:hypothetical protein
MQWGPGIAVHPERPVDAEPDVQGTVQQVLGGFRRIAHRNGDVELAVEDAFVRSRVLDVDNEDSVARPMSAQIGIPFPRSAKPMRKKHGGKRTCSGNRGMDLNGDLSLTRFVKPVLPEHGNLSLAVKPKNNGPIPRVFPEWQSQVFHANPNAL